MATSSTSSPPQMKEEEVPRNWAELPPELTALVFNRLSAAVILENAQKVCMPWHRVSKDPSLWRKIDMRTWEDDLSFCRGLDFDSLCRQAVDRSEGGLVEINVGGFGTDSLLSYIAHRSSNLSSLGIGVYRPSTDNGLVDAVAELPLLEELEVSGSWSTLNLKAIGHSCPKLKTLKLNCSLYERSEFRCDDVDALAIAESMPELCHLAHLQLLGNRLTNTGLNAILDNCPNLEHLDLRQCLNINLFGDLKKRCLERIKDFRRPNDSTADYPSYVCFNDSDDDEIYDLDYDDYGYDDYGYDDYGYSSDIYDDYFPY